MVGFGMNSCHCLSLSLVGCRSCAPWALPRLANFCFFCLAFLPFTSLLQRRSGGERRATCAASRRFFFFFFQMPKEVSKHLGHYVEGVVSGERAFVSASKKRRKEVGDAEKKSESERGTIRLWGPPKKLRCMQTFPSSSFLNLKEERRKLAWSLASCVRIGLSVHTELHVWKRRSRLAV